MFPILFWRKSVSLLSYDVRLFLWSFSSVKEPGLPWWTPGDVSDCVVSGSHTQVQSRHSKCDSRAVEVESAENKRCLFINSLRYTNY